jgi:hypothetical protein
MASSAKSGDINAMNKEIDMTTKKLP